jgi:hypothetical protein
MGREDAKWLKNARVVLAPLRFGAGLRVTGYGMWYAQCNY